MENENQQFLKGVEALVLEENQKKEAQNPQELQKSLSELPGPIFEAKPGWGGKLANWLKRNFKKKILPIIIVVLVALISWAFLIKERAGQEKELFKEEEKIEKKEGVVIKEIEGKKIFKLTARKGEGITHLARRALKEYLNENQEAGKDLKAEHKIFIEDYLKDLHGERFLNLGEELEFSADDIGKAIGEAKNLSENELANLSQYAQLVSGL